MTASAPASPNSAQRHRPLCARTEGERRDSNPRPPGPQPWQKPAVTGGRLVLNRRGVSQRRTGRRISFARARSVVSHSRIHAGGRSRSVACATHDRDLLRARVRRAGLGSRHPPHGHHGRRTRVDRRAAIRRASSQAEPSGGSARDAAQGMRRSVRDSCFRSMPAGLTSSGDRARFARV